jgi:hypothetical protein
MTRLSGPIKSESVWKYLPLTLLAVLLLVLCLSQQASAKAKDKMPHGGHKQDKNAEWIPPAETANTSKLSIILGCPADSSIIANILSTEDISGCIEYGGSTGHYTNKTETVNISATKPSEIVLNKLQPNTQYFYRLNGRKIRDGSPFSSPEYSFHTQRPPGSTFTFAVQGDSHPERRQQHDPQLYARTLLNAAAHRPDFYILLGDDFSVDALQDVNADTVAQRYILQRPFLGLIGHSSPVFLVNGNHEQAALCNLNGTPNNVAVWAQNARNLYYPQPAPGRFNSGDAEPVKYIGQLKDYYAWTWGDALFIVIDPYWHSPSPVDNVFGGGEKRKDLWTVTLGDAQYQWLKQTLEQSRSRNKFVFAHHVLGTGRGGVELSGLYEWGGRNKKGDWEFDRKRPGWELPIHQLMAKYAVTIFFQGHDHLFARQERDGIIYQTVPEPADPHYVAYNDQAYETGTKWPNSGFIQVTVAPGQLKVDYIRSWLPADETSQHKNGEIAYSYTVQK